jgi:rare lipoprotein A
MSLLVAATFLTAAGWAQTPAAAPAGAVTGRCSYYAKSMDGNITSSLQKFDSAAMTAAHRRYRMGTKLKVTNLANDKSVMVTVNDRGPYAKGVDLSVTYRAAEELGFLKEGVAKVRFEPVP